MAELTIKVKLWVFTLDGIYYVSLGPSTRIWVKSLVTLMKSAAGEIEAVIGQMIDAYCLSMSVKILKT